MLIGYARVSKADGSQSLDLQRDAFVAEGICCLSHGPNHKLLKINVFPDYELT